MARRFVTGKVVIHVKHRSTGGQYPVEIGAVLVHRHVEHGDAVTGAGGYLPEQVDIPLDAGDQHPVPGLGEA